jgi:hypothetical protein
MPAKTINLLDLPNELLSQCFCHLRKVEKWGTRELRNARLVSKQRKVQQRGNNDDIQNVRLVSKHCNAISSPFLISSATIYITSASLAHMEELCDHPVFSQSIKEVEINCSYYDKCMAESIGLYGAHCGFTLFRDLEMYSRGSRSRMYPVDENALVHISDGWTAFNEEDYFKNNPDLTEKQQWLLDAHEQYRQRYEDQMRIKVGNAHIQRICVALTKLSHLQSITLTDARYYSPQRHATFSDPDLLETCLLASTWKGSFITAFLTRPPVEMIPDLFTALAQTDVRPTSFSIDIKPPTDLQCLELREPARKALKTVLSRAQTLSFNMNRWDRRDSLAEDNNRPRPEMLALCSLTSAYFDTPTLKNLEISFEGYPAAFDEPPTVSILDILPLATQNWPLLHKLSLRYMPLSAASAVMLVGVLRGSLEVLDCYSLLLVNGSWIDVVDTFRELEKLKSFTIDYPRGGECGDQGRYTFPSEEVAEYVLRMRAEKTLPQYFSNSEL